MARKSAGQPVGPLSPSAKRRALLICNGKVKSLHLDLRGVAKDAENLSRMLGDQNRAGFEVRCLLDEGLLNVRKGIAQACSESNADDTLLIYYSGSSLVDTRGELLLPVADSDGNSLVATCIESDFILAQMRRSACRQFVLIIDGCHSGAFFRHNRGIPDGMIALTSCNADETSMDTDEGGAFTQSFLRALSGGQADGHHDGTVTVDDAYEYIRRDPVLTKMSSNHPQKWVWNLTEPIVLVRTTMSVFLSYARSDAAAADVLTKGLEQQGISVWRDISGIPGGAEWRDSLLSAFAKSQALVFLMSDKALESKWVRRELEFADSKGLPILPVCSGDVRAPDWFALQFGGLQRAQVDLKNPFDGQSVARALRGATAK